MARAKITRENVFKVASQLQKKGEKVTADSVRETLGMGSKTTVLKYLHEWKATGASNPKLNSTKLQADLAEKLKIIENLTLELCNSRALVASESAKNAKLRGRILELETRLEEKALSAQDVLKRSAESERVLKGSFDQAVLLLSEQLRAINLQAIQKVQEAGQHYDDKVMELKLELRDLKDQLALKDKELKKLGDQLIEQAIKSKVYG